MDQVKVFGMFLARCHGKLDKLRTLWKLLDNYFTYADGFRLLKDLWSKD